LEVAAESRGARVRLELWEVESCKFDGMECRKVSLTFQPSNFLTFNPFEASMKEHMFDQSETREGKDKSRIVIALSGIAVLLVAGLIFIVASRPPAESPGEQWPGPGSPEFDSYVPNVAIKDIEKFTNSTIVGRRQAKITATLANNGDRVITGMKINAAAVGFGGDTLAFKIATPIPRQREKLGPGETAKIEIGLDPIPDPDKIQDFNLQVVALRLK